MSVPSNNGACYGTHRLVLMGLSSWLTSRKQPVKKVLELGSGPASTSLFLSNSFPELEQLVSTETSEDWARVVSMLYGGDKRLHLHMHDDEEVLLQEVAEYAPFDVILVDGATNAGRLAAIPRCLEMARFVVVHDTQEPELRAAHSMALYSFTSVIESPWTTVLSNHEPPFGYTPLA